MDIRNGAADHIGLQTTDRNVDHKIWPCISHPPELACEDALRMAGKRGWRSLPAARQVPAREWVDKR